jgi:DNA primase
MNIKDLVEEAGYTPKKKASTHGGEYCSPCPFCKEGDDRFLIWPNRLNGNGSYTGGRFDCHRHCGKKGDAITFIRELYGLSYKEACERLKIEPKKRDVSFVTKKEIKLPIAKEPSKLWKDKAMVFVEWSHIQLMANQKALAFVMNRGFSLESIKRFKLGFNPKDLWRVREEWGVESQTKEDGTLKKLWLPAGIVIPTFSEDQVIKIKVRRSNWKEGDELPKYVELSGSKQCHSVYGQQSLKVTLIIESELDALLMQQEASDLLYCVALGGSSKSLDLETDQLLKRTSILLFCPDFDEAGAKACAKWKKIFPSIQRVLTPDGKSAGDAYLAGVNLREWIISSLETIQRNETKRK